MKKLTNEEFIEKAKQVHDDKYDYSKVEYIDAHTKVCIICPEHGEFWQTPSAHLGGHGCSKCAGNFHGKESFMEKAKQVHSNKYDYSKVNYINALTNVCIICPEHGEFWQSPSKHLKGHGCPKCAKTGVLSNTTDFIEKAKQVHGNKYDYSKVQYINNHTKVCIICPKHGEFWQVPSGHLSGRGCAKCAGKFMDKEYFIEKAQKIHGDKYDYSKVEYVNVVTKVCIICPEHGEFYQIPNSHLNGAGCPKCAGNIMSKELFIKKAKQVHGNKYDYSKVEYVNAETKVCIICPEHGEFWQTPHNHLSGYGCSKCAGVFMNQESFINKSRKVHGNKYDYSKVNYINNCTKVCIICSEHGEFWQIPSSHLSGAGCPKCNMSHLERDVMHFLDRHNVDYEYQKRFEWLGRQSLDFYLPKYNIAIECQGIQHYQPVKHFGGEDEYKDTQERDNRKKLLCEQHNIKLRYYNEKTY